MYASQTDFSVRKILGIDAAPASSCELDPVVPSRKRKRRTRTTFSTYALEVLEFAFSRNSYPDVYERIQLSRLIGEQECRVQVWFQNRRARAKRDSQIANHSSSLVISDILSTSTSSSENGSSSPVRRPSKRNTEFSSEPFQHYSSNFLPTSSSSVRPHDVTTFSGNTVFGEVKSPLWSPGSPTFSRFFEFPPKALTPLPCTPGYVNLSQIHSDESMSDQHSSRPSSGDSRYSGPDDVRGMRVGDRASRNSSIQDLRRSEGRPADVKVLGVCFEDDSDSGPDLDMVIGRLEDSETEAEGGLVIDLSLPKPTKKRTCPDSSN